MLNPSTADEVQNDPTIRRCIGFARAWQCSRLIIANIFAIRATDPRVMLAADDPTGPDNDRWVAMAAHEADNSNGPVVCAWGAHGGHRARDLAVMEALDLIGVRPACLGETAAGFPRHPLYVRGSTSPTPYRGR
jgi:hypothetical protein